MYFYWQYVYHIAIVGESLSPNHGSNNNKKIPKVKKNVIFFTLFFRNKNQKFGNFDNNMCRDWLLLRRGYIPRRMLCFRKSYNCFLIGIFCSHCCDAVQVFSERCKLSRLLKPLAVCIFAYAAFNKTLFCRHVTQVNQEAVSCCSSL